MERASKPVISRSTLAEDLSVQEIDLQTIERARARRAKQLKELNPETYAPEFLAKRRAEIDAETARIVTPLLRHVTERAARATKARALWDPARRRQEAALADPVAAAAVVARVVRVPFPEIPALAQSAAEQNDWLLADAVAGRAASAPTTASPEEVDAYRLALDTLGAMDAERRREVERMAQATGYLFVKAQVAAAEAVGKPMDVLDKLTLGHQYPEPAAVTA